MPEKNIFISYSRANTGFARDLYDKLKDEGFTLWRDRSEMESGDWWRQIQEAIERVDKMILVLSPKALESTVVAQEWHYARQKGKLVIPVQAEDVDFNTVPRWMKRVHWFDLRPDAPERDLTWSKLLDQLRKPYEPRRVPFPEAQKLPSDFVERPDISEPIVRALVDETHGAVGISAALRGAGGYGKTTIARAVIHDVRVRGAFDDGILWITLGESYKDDDSLSRLRDLIRQLTGTEPIYETPEAAKNALAELLKDRYVLIVIDDVWKKDHAELFCVGGANCAYLITTRLRETLPEGAREIKVDAMQTSQAVALLAANLPNCSPEQLSAQERDALRKLTERLGEWALLLKLANGVLRSRIRNNERLEQAIDYANRALDRRGFAAFDARDSDSRNSAVAKSLSVSLELLVDGEAERFQELAIFPEDADVPLAAVQRLWRATSDMDEDDSEDLCLRLESISLLSSFDLDKKQLRLHDTIRQFLCRKLNERLPELHAKFLNAYNVETWADLPPDEPYLWDHLAYHLSERNKRLPQTPEAAAKADSAAQLLREQASQHRRRVKAALRESNDARAAEHYNDARRLYHEAVETSPMVARTWVDWAGTEEELKRFGVARRLYQVAVKVEPISAVWNAYALFEKEQRNFAEARRLFERAVTADPDHAPAWQAWALFEKERRQYDEARRLFGRAVETDPDYAPAWQAWALFEKERRQYDEARRLFGRAVETDPDYALAWLAWAVLEREQRNFDEARRLFGRAVEADPGHAPAWLAWAVLEREQRNYDEARRLFGRAVEADPGHAPAWLAWALFEKEQRNYDEARCFFQRAVEADPDHAPAWQAYALFEKEQRNFAEARRLFERAVTADPDHAPAWLAWALFEKEQRNYDEARRLFGRAVAADPLHVQSWLAYALFEKEQRNYGDARRLFGRVAEGDIDALSWRAYALFEKEQRNFDEARRLFRCAVEADPFNARSWQAYALFEKEQGNHVEAQRLLEQGLQHVRDRRGKGLLHATLGSLSASSDDLAAAEAHFRQALEHNDEDAMTHYHFAISVLLRMDRREEACRHLCRAKSLRIKKEHQRRMIESAVQRNGCQCQQ